MSVARARTAFDAAAAALVLELRRGVRELESVTKVAQQRVQPLARQFTSAGEALLEALQGDGEFEDLSVARQEAIDLYDELTHPDEEGFDGVLEVVKELAQELRKQESQLETFIASARRVR